MCVVSLFQANFQLKCIRKKSSFSLLDSLFKKPARFQGALATWTALRGQASLSRDIHLLPPADISASGSQVFGLGLELELRFTTLASSVHRPLGLDETSTSGFLGLRLADNRSWDFSASVIA